MMARVVDTLKDIFGSQTSISIPRRLLRGLPAIILGVLLNTLDAASTGLLVFPSGQEGPQFGQLQVQAMAMYIMSTITNQLAMTLGGSLFPGALGSMLIEVLPFLRNIAIDIQTVLGPESPKLLPTVVAAYAMTSFLIGFCFVALGILRLGWVVEYFPSTVLTGVIGAIGLSLFLLSLQLTLPPSAPELTLSSARHVLFNNQHGPLLVASLLPTIFLCYSLRSDILRKWSHGFTDHAMYVPAYVLAIAAIFWIIVAAQGQATAPGMARLSSQGWLFTVNDHPTEGLGDSWNYWKLFDFSLVEWSAMKSSIQNIALLVIVGVLNLPIYIPAMAIMLNKPKFNMNWELIGHGISNLLSGATGSLPNLVVLSNSRMFTFANGGRLEALIVTGFTFVLFFVSARLLPYIPTILASILVFFLGLELMADAVWSSTKQLLWIEWIVVVGTMVACTFVGYLPGFGIGVGLAIVSHALFALVDTKAQLATITSKQTNRFDKRGEKESAVVSLCEHTGKQFDSPRPDGLSIHQNLENSEASEVDKYVIEASEDAFTDDTKVVSTAGTLFFASAPSLEKQIDQAFGQKTENAVIIDFTHTHRIETCIGQMLSRKAAEFTCTGKPSPFIFAGVKPNSGLADDFSRASLQCYWPDYTAGGYLEDKILCYPDLIGALTASRGTCSSSSSLTDDDIWSEAEKMLSSSLYIEDHDTLLHGNDISRELIRAGAQLHKLEAGQKLCLQDSALVFIVRGIVRISPSQINDTASAAIRVLDHHTPTRRRALFDACKNLLVQGLTASKRFILRRQAPEDNIENAIDDSATSYLLPRAETNFVFCGPRDFYAPTQQGVQQTDEEKGSSAAVGDVVEPLQSFCHFISVPHEPREALQNILFALERRRMHESMIQNLVHSAR